MFGKCLRTPFHKPCFKIETSRQFAPNLKFVDSHNSHDSNPCKDYGLGIKPDVCVYRASDTKVSGINSALVEFMIEFKWNPSADPFTLPAKNSGNRYPNQSAMALNTLGQITDYVATQLSAQFRTHIYSVLIGRKTATILRWDRAGAVVTEPIDYNESPYLVEFFRRYSCASPAMRGMDQSVSEPTLAEETAARGVLNVDKDTKLFKLEIPRANRPSNYFITLGPTASLYTPPGRGTRVFHAYDIATGAKVLLKDSWRVNLPTIQAEGLTYETLNTAKVRNIPTCLASGDIGTDKYHATSTNIFDKGPATSSHFVPHRHYRLVLNIIGRPLTKFASSYEMVTAVRDALVGEFQFGCKEMTLIDLLAHMDAHSAGILHRDISPGNIIIHQGGGLLIDWDLSKPVNMPSMGLEYPRRATRTVQAFFVAGPIIADT